MVAKWRQRLQLPTPFSTSLSLYLLLPIPLLCPHSFSSSSTIMLKRIKMIEVIIFIYLHNSQGGKEGKLQSKHTHTHLDWHTHHLFAVCPQHTQCLYVWGVRVASISHVKSSFASSHNLRHVACFSKQRHEFPAPSQGNWGH